MTLNRNIFRMVVGALAVLLIILSSTAFSVREEHTALVTRFGKLLREETEPGLHWKLPWPIDRAALIDRRSRVFNTRHTEMLTRDKKNVILLSYALWRVADPLDFYRAIGSMDAADAKLDGLVTDAKIGVLGGYDMANLVSTDAANLKVDQIEREVLAAAAQVARDKYGIEIVQVGFKRLSLPEENVSFVFDQMRAERQREAAEYRAKGEREAAILRSEADTRVAEIMAEAREEASRKRGAAEAEAAAIYTTAHQADEELFRFLRNLKSLEETLSTDTSLILRTDSEPFTLLKDQGLWDSASEDQGK